MLVSQSARKICMFVFGSCNEVDVWPNLLSVGLFPRHPTTIVSIKFSSKHRLILLQENFEKAWRQDTTRVLVIRSRVRFKCATAATLCATLAVHARHPFPVSAHVRCLFYNNLRHLASVRLTCMKLHLPQTVQCNKSKAKHTTGV